jgi:alpha/beta hydrolase family protein
MRQTLNLFVSALIAATALARSGDAADTVPSSTVAGPTTGGSRGQPFGAMTPADLAQSHYTEAEYFYSGSASAYEKDGAWGMDGVWRIKPAKPTEYKVRLVVRRPVDARRFNGIVVVEWLNVTGLQEGAADYSQMKEEILTRFPLVPISGPTSMSRCSICKRKATW